MLNGTVSKYHYSLNLAVANRVFIVEPQWNPSVENQAIARALRIGQEQPVLVTRYIVQDSVEQVGTPFEKKNLLIEIEHANGARQQEGKGQLGQWVRPYYALYLRTHVLPLYTNGTMYYTPLSHD